MVDVSVIVCSYNRAESLRDTIESLVNQRAICSYEIIVVDNNSKDGTRDVAESFNGKVKYAFESRQGLSYARNTGIKEAKGQIIAFTDDDVIADSNWVSSIYQCFKETRALAVGGQIKRLWNCERPEWLAEEIMGPLIVQDLGPQRKKWDQQNRHMIGANMSFHRAIFEQHGIFREALGRKGDRLIGGEDREIFQRLQKAGIAIFYEPKAIVHHKVEKQRLSKDFMRQWFWEVGRTLGHEIQWKWKFIFTAAPIWLWRDLTRALRRLMRAHFEPGVHETEKFVSQLWVLHYGGRFFERFLHWLPFGLGKGLCAFKEEIKEYGNTK
ncbi:MAG: glycosyltransferase family 2 protein [Candidatus Omnitrophica bacterium]|nr:glycosyltransferase family 2 protein [Candidatus Omnitrophota bacterium]